MSYYTEKVNNLMVPQGSDAAWGPNDAPIFIVLGQSNAYGHGTSLPAGERVTTGYANVFTLDRTANANALYNTTVNESSIVWTGMTTLGTHNIGTNSTTLGAQDHTCHAANQFAKLWQNHITAGNTLGLPNLYVVQFSWGSQGIDASHSTTGLDRWNPERAANDVESLYPRAVQTFTAVINALRAAGKNPRVLAVQWNQWETEAMTDTASLNSAMNFLRIRAGIRDALGSDNVPWRFFYPMAPGYTATRLSRLRAAIEAARGDDPINTEVIDTRTAPSYTGVSPTFGIFQGDNVHYTLDVQKWFADLEWAKVQGGHRGVSLPAVKGRLSALALANSIQPSPKVLKWIANQYTAGEVATRAKNGLASTTVREVAGWTRQLRCTVEPLTGKKVFQPNIVNAGTGAGGQILFSFDATPTDARYGYITWNGVGNPNVGVCLFVKPRAAASTYGSLGYGYFCLWISSAYTGVPQYAIHGTAAAGTTHDTGVPFAVMWDLANMTSGEGNIRAMQYGGSPVGATNVYPGTPTIVASSLTNISRALTTGWPMNELVQWRAGVIPANNGTMTVEWFNKTTNAWVVAIQQRNMNAILTAGNNADGGQLGLVFGMSATGNTLAQQNQVLNASRMTDIEFVSLD